MKKLISLLLALVMVFSLATVAAAAESESGEEAKTLTYVTEVELAKVYKLSTSTAVTDEGAVDYAKSPTETFKFTIEKVSAEETGLNAEGEETTVDNMPMFEDTEVEIAFVENKGSPHPIFFQETKLCSS